jgi:integration host factor subunit beta
MPLSVSKANTTALNARAMTKSELMERITTRQAQLSAKDIELAIKTMIEHMAQTLSQGHRIEIRGFGSFSLHYRAPRIGRNPKTGESVGLSGKYVPHFKPGKELRNRVNESLLEYPTPAAQRTRKQVRDGRASRVDADD